MANETPFNDMFQWYEKLYPAVAISKIYSDYCIKVHGMDLSQQGFYTMSQIDFMLSKLNINSSKNILEIGCGLGKLAEYIFDIYQSFVLGIDYSPAAIKLAKERTKEKLGKLTFEIGNINELGFLKGTFDIILSLDCIFFAEDLTATLKKINSLLKPNGKLVIIYGVYRFDKNEPIEVLYSNSSPLANAFNNAGYFYEVFDFTEELYKHQLLKRKTVTELKQKFIDEKTFFLYEYLYRESIDLTQNLEDFKNFCSYYLYIYEKKT